MRSPHTNELANPHCLERSNTLWRRLDRWRIVQGWLLKSLWFWFGSKPRHALPSLSFVSSLSLRQKYDRFGPHVTKWAEQVYDYVIHRRLASVNNVEKILYPVEDSELRTRTINIFCDRILSILETRSLSSVSYFASEFDRKNTTQPCI